MPVAAPPAAGAPPAVTPPQGGKQTPDLDDSLYGAGAEIDELDGKSPPPKKEAEPDPEPEDEKEPDKGKEQESSPRDEIDQEIEELDVIENPDADPEKEKAKKAADKAKAEAGKEKAKEEQEKTPQRARDLKLVYEQTKAEKKALESKLAETTAELEKARRANPDEVKAISERLEKSEARRNELESEIRHLNYAKSEEYRTKYEGPYRKAWQDAVAELSELTVETETGTRQATAEDLVQLANMPLGEARKAAEAMFGPAADDVMAHRRKIRDLSKAQEEALESSRKGAAEREKTLEAEQKKAQEKLRGIWQSESEAYSKKFPRWTKPVEGDTEGNSLLEKGFAEVDKFFNDREISQEDRVKLHVRLRAKAANHDRMALRLKRATERIKKLQDEISAYEGAEPPAGKAGKSTGKKVAGNVFEEAESEIEALDEA